MIKNIEQLCQSDIVNIHNILHINDSIEYEILEHFFKHEFYCRLVVVKTKGVRPDSSFLKLRDEITRVVKNLKEKNSDSFKALLLLQGKDPEDEKELDNIIRNLVLQRFASLMTQGYIIHTDDEVALKDIDTKTADRLYSLVHRLEHEERKQDTDKAMKDMMDGMAKVSKDLFGADIKMDMSKLFENNMSGKVDLSKILGTEKDFMKGKQEDDNSSSK